jgi:hypothetical protein
MKKYLFLLFCLPVFAFGQSTDATLSALNTSSIYRQIYNPTSAFNFNAAIINSKMSLAGGTLWTNSTITQAGFNTAYSGIGTVTFSPTSTRSGLNFGSFAGNPGTINNGDAWYNSTLGQLRFGVSASNLIFLGTTGLTSGRIPVSSGTFLLGDFSTLTYTSGTNVFSTGRGIFTNANNAGAINLTPAAGDPSTTVSGDQWFNSTLQAFRLNNNGTLYTNVIGVTNGLTESSTGIVSLGGTLTGATSLAMGGFNITHTGTGTEIFSPSATLSGLNTGVVAGNPSTINNGDVWVNNTTATSPIYNFGGQSTAINVILQPNSTNATSQTFTITSNVGSGGTPGVVNIQGANSSTTAITGGAANLTGGAAVTGNANGGPVSVNGGTGIGSGTGGTVSIQSGSAGATAGANSGLILINTGTPQTTGTSGTITVQTGSGLTTTMASGPINISSGATVSASSGAVTLQSGTVTTAGNTGQTNIATGSSLGGSSGTINIITGTGTTSTGTINIATGNASSGASGSITLTTGTATGTRGNVIIAAPSLLTLHLTGNSVAPGIAAGTGAGTGPTVSVIRASDLAGTVSVLTGTTPTASAVVATITFNATYVTTPTVILTPANAAAAALTGTSQVFAVGASATTFTITAGSAALAATTTYLWSYMVIQ